MFRQLKNNESGMVLVMVLMATIIMMIFSIGVISRGISQSKFSETQVDRIKAEQLAMGAYARAYTDLASGDAMTTNFSETLDNKTYTATVTASAFGGPSNVSTISVAAPFWF